MTPEALAAHYRAVADASPVPVIVYQVPLKMSTLEFSTGLVAELARHDNIVGLKDSRGVLDLVAELVDATPDDFQVLVGNGAIFLQALQAGAAGGILGVANVVPEECSLVFQHHGAGEMEAASRVQKLVAPLHTGLRGRGPRPAPASPERRRADRTGGPPGHGGDRLRGGSVG